MSDPTISTLKNRLQAGVLLVDHLLTVHGDAILDVDLALTNDLRKWVAGTLRDVPSVVRGTDVRRCGQLRRDPDGSWWWGSFFLGSDGDPETSLELGNHTSVVTIALGEALDAAASRLKAAGDKPGFRAVRRVLFRYHRWQSTGVW